MWTEAATHLECDLQAAPVMVLPQRRLPKGCADHLLHLVTQ